MAMKDDKLKSLETLLVLVGAMIVIFWITQKKIFLLIALLIIVIGITSSFLTGKISWLWLQFSELLGAIMSKVILTIVYFVFLVPVALFYRLSKKDALSLKRKDHSYYINRDHQYSPKDIENIW